VPNREEYRRNAPIPLPPNPRADCEARSRRDESVASFHHGRALNSRGQEGSRGVTLVQLDRHLRQKAIADLPSRFRLRSLIFILVPLSSSSSRRVTFSPRRVGRDWSGRLEDPINWSVRAINSFPLSCFRGRRREEKCCPPFPPLSLFLLQGARRFRA